MIAALILHIVITAQMTVPWIGGSTVSTPTVNKYQPWILVPGRPVIEIPGQAIVLYQ